MFSKCRFQPRPRAWPAALPLLLATLRAAAPADQNFDSEPVGSLNDASVTIAGVTYTTNDNNKQAIAIVDDGNLAKGPNHALGYRSSSSKACTLVSFASADGAEFKLNSFAISSGKGSTTNFVIRGFRDGTEVAAEKFEVGATTSGSGVSISVTGNGSGIFDVSGNAAWENIDEVRIEGDDLDVDIDDLDFSPPVVPNAPPVVATSGGATAFVEADTVASTPVVIDAALTVGDADHATLASATVSIAGNFQAGQDILAFTNAGGAHGNIAASYSAGAGVLTLTSSGATATLAQWQAALRAVTYTNSSNTPATATRIVYFYASDGIDTGGPAAKFVSVTSVNDTPVNSAPATQSMAMNTTRLFNAANANLISIADVDAGGGALRVALTAANGTFTLGATAGLGFTVGDGTAAPAMTFTGSLISLNAALNGLRFTPTPGYYGAASLQIVTSDLGNTGSGGAKTDTDTIAITVTSAPPLVLSVGSPSANGTYKIGDTLSVTVAFDQVVVVNTAGGAPTLLLETGVVDRHATYVSGTGSATLAFAYTVQAGDLSADLDFHGAAALALNGATLRNPAGDNAVLTLPAPGAAGSLAAQKALVIDGVVPVVASVAVPASATYGAGQVLAFTVNFSEAVVVGATGGTPRLALTLDTGGTVFAAYVSGSGTAALVFRHTLAPGGFDATGIALAAALDANGGTLRDAAGNAAALALNGVAPTAGVRVDAVAPAVLAIDRAGASPAKGAGLAFTVTFAEPVAGVDAADFTLVATGTAVGAVASVTAVGAAVYTVAISGVAGDGTLRLDLNATGAGIADTAGNPLVGGFAAGQLYTIDNTAPVITSPAALGGTFGSPITYAITANESPVTFAATGLPAGLALGAGGVISGVAGASGNFSVTLSATDAAGNTGTRSLALDLGRALATVQVSGLAQVYDGTPHRVTVVTVPAGLPWSATYGGSATAPTAAGAYAVVVTINDPNYFGIGSGALVVARAAQTVAFPAPGAAAIGVPLALAATASSGLPVAFTLVSGNATLSGATLTLRDSFPVVVRATQMGDGNYAPASADVTLAAPRLPQAIAFAPPADRRAGDPAFALAASADSGLPVAFALVSGPATLAGDIVTLTGEAGTVVVRAAQPGDAIYAAAAEVVRAFAAEATRLVNFSTLARLAPPGGRPLIAGFVVAGPAAKRMLVRAAGPALAGLGVPGAAANPRLQIFDAGGRLVVENDDWSGAETAAAFAQAGAFALPAGGRDAGVVVTLAPGAYTLHVADTAGGGLALAEIYDASPRSGAEPQRLVNFSALGAIAAPGEVVTGGFVIAGGDAKRVLIRAAGPALAALGVAGALADPRLAIFSGAALVAQNDDWGADIPAAATAAGAFAFAAGSKDAAVVVTLPAGNYTMQVSGAGGGAGLAMLEVYELPE